MTTPIAILVGSVIVAIGLYFGLSARPPPAPPPTPSTAASTSEDVAARPSITATAPRETIESPPPIDEPQPVPATASGTKPARSVSAKQAAESLARYKKRLVAVCWAPLAAKTPEPASLTYTLTPTFGPDGKQLARGISEPRRTPREGVAQCIQRELPSLQIEPRGDTIEIPLELTLP